MMLDPGERLVVDASVALKWVIPEADSDRAAALLDHSLAAPDLLFAECANALWKKLRRGELTGEEAVTAAQTLGRAELTIVSAREYSARAVAIAAELDHPAYDGLYLAVAEALGLRLVTADARLMRKVDQVPGRFRQMVTDLSRIG